MDFIQHIDTELFLFLNSLGTPEWDGFWLYITRTLSGLPIFVLLLFFCLKTFGIRRTLSIVFFTVLIIAVSDQLSNLFKNILVKRLRPCHNEDLIPFTRLVKDYCGDMYGYFSAHASNSFALATFYFFLFRKRIMWLSVVLTLWAILTSYSRIYIGVHYPLDLITGWTIGFLLGMAGQKLSSVVWSRIKS